MLTKDDGVVGNKSNSVKPGAKNTGGLNKCDLFAVDRVVAPVVAE